MSYIKFDESSLRKAQNEFNKNTNEILECIEKINKEMDDLPKILNTPKFSKKLPHIIEILKADEEIVRNNNENLDFNFTNVISSYQEYDESIKELVGDINE